MAKPRVARIVIADRTENVVILRPVAPGRVTVAIHEAEASVMDFPVASLVSFLQECTPQDMPLKFPWRKDKRRHNLAIGWINANLPPALALFGKERSDGPPPVWHTAVDLPKLIKSLEALQNGRPERNGQNGRLSSRKKRIKIK
jgi:hypothetical protein